MSSNIKKIVVFCILFAVVMQPSLGVSAPDYLKSLSKQDLLASPQPFADWNAVLLFFNLDLPAGDLPPGYSATSVLDAKEFLDEGPNPAAIRISDFMSNYWKTLSYDALEFGGVDTPRDGTGDPLIPKSTTTPYAWGELINDCLDANPEEVWTAAGGLMKDGKRWIPAVVLVQKYPLTATAMFGGYTRTIDGHDYLIGDRHHIPYDLSYTDFKDTPIDPDNEGRKIWGTMCHEFGHNFMEIWDLYGPQGCTGYWDLLGDASRPGRMSEIFSVFKHHNGWLSYKDIINGPSYPETSFSLTPYTTTGETIKVVPDPVNNPKEYFILEYRKSTGSELWRPDGGLIDNGLCIIHVNERLGIPLTTMMRESPFFDVEFADFSDNGTSRWTGNEKLQGVLFPQPHQESFTPYTLPNSSFYGGRRSGLYITNIHVSGGQCHFDIRITNDPQVGWVSSEHDRCLAGYFTPQSIQRGEELFIRNENHAALLTYEEGQWLVKARQEHRIDDWSLGRFDYEVVGDYDGDGFDEIYIRSPRYVAILKWDDTAGAFTTLGTTSTLTSVLVNAFSWLTIGPAINVILGELILDVLRDDYREFSGDFDGDGCDEIAFVGPRYLGFYNVTDTNEFDMKALAWDRIDTWRLGPNDRRHVGRFMTTDRDQILMRSDDYLSLLIYHDHMGIWEICQQYDHADTWDLSNEDLHTLGDYDGDTRDELFIHTPHEVGVLKFNFSTMNFKTLWQRAADIEPMPGRDDTLNFIYLSAEDKTYSGQFLRQPNIPREGVLLRNNTAISVLTWESTSQYTGMRVRQQLTFPCSAGRYYYPVAQWTLDPLDIFVLGDFHRKGPDRVMPKKDNVGDNLTDVFIYHPASQGTTDAGPFSTTIGINYVEFNPIEKPGWIREEIGLIWHNYIQDAENEYFMMLTP